MSKQKNEGRTILNVPNNQLPFSEKNKIKKVKWIIQTFFENWVENLCKYAVLLIPFAFGIPGFSTWVEKQDWFFWLLIIVGALGLILNIYLDGSNLGKKVNEIHTLTIKNADLEQNAQRNQDYIDSMKESIESIPNEIIESIFHFLRLGNEDRISLYSFDNDTLYMTGRYSSSTELRASGRLTYPKNQGYIGKVWNGVKDDLYVVENLVDPSKASRKYMNYVCRNSNLSEDIISKLNMKSRSYYIRLLRKNHKEVAVFVLESKNDKLPKSKEEIDYVLNGEFGKLLVMYVNRNNRNKERKSV